MSFTKLLQQLDVQVDDQLLELALTHRSYAYENGQIPTNERLEFLGDALLGAIVTEYLYRRFPDLAEGQLAKLRAAVVNATSLGEVARSFALGPMIRLGRGEVSTGGHDKTSILADTVEALIGAVYLSSGVAATETLVHHLFDPLVEHASTLGAGLDWKTSLQEVCAQLGESGPTYDITESGPDHAKQFEAVAVVGQRRFASGHGYNKKQAEQEAAAHAFGQLKAELETHPGDTSDPSA